MSFKKDYRPYLYDIHNAIERIIRYTDGMDRTSFLNDELVQDAVTRRIEIIGEAVSRLPEHLKQRYPDIPWQAIMDMRNKLIHDYGHVDLANHMAQVLQDYR